MAIRTERLRLGLEVTPLTRRRPWNVAREAVGIDASIARFGEQTDARTRGELLDEGLEMLAELWTGEPFSFRGKHFVADEVTFLPRPVQRPRVPIWIGGGYPNPRHPARRPLGWRLPLQGDPRRPVGEHDTRRRAGAQGRRRRPPLHDRRRHRGPLPTSRWHGSDLHQRGVQELPRALRLVLVLLRTRGVSLLDARNHVHQVLLLDELGRHGCQVEFHDQLLLQIRGAVAEYERTLITEHMRRGRQAQLRAGTLLPWTRSPFGYRLDPKLSPSARAWLGWSQSPRPWSHSTLPILGRPYPT
jgi:hypothetical protein